MLLCKLPVFNLVVPSDDRKMEEHKPKEQKPKANENKPVMNE
jgi:hypothetical protein